MTLPVDFGSRSCLQQILGKLDELTVELAKFDGEWNSTDDLVMKVTSIRTALARCIGGELVDVLGMNSTPEMLAASLLSAKALSQSQIQASFGTCSRSNSKRALEA